ncbi:2-hydroxychromene-2-carboxylate isomerase [Yoonia sediminilitoris]|uniref:2-hydroxychromene-2-carboxylate isomerase n=1 Tax=Yoonia sediminilitoris TaxID=1286148 RepID=A0A2T6KQV7_9RHOB|nr:2-hydroxychromene-2-carboxylate isomerase [Yoonia sediminilitoris]PUB18943.1 2-hydroxychromene-2-carboxylate isomerase [Yoonia sediminilitoris]RCW99111.1 2-hydroxychromene-2-carboxylate isomerase [Yoonia sediminilitoris]
MPATKVVDYYFAPMSGYAYLGHARFAEIATGAGAKVRYHPLDMAQVFAAAGSFPPAKYPDVRQKHRKADMARWAAKLGLPINTSPAFWPVPMALACRVIVGAGTIGADQGAVVNAVLSAVWVHDLNIAEVDDMAKALDLHGLDAEPVLAAASDRNVVASAEAETKAAIDKGIFGSPTYMLGDDWFFGQDRLDFLGDLLAR